MQEPITTYRRRDGRWYVTIRQKLDNGFVRVRTEPLADGLPLEFEPLERSITGLTYIRPNADGSFVIGITLEGCPEHYELVVNDQDGEL